MSTFSDTEANGQRAGSNFSQTCNLFRQFLKEKRGCGAISLGMSGKKIEPRGNPTTTMDLLTSLEQSDDISKQSLSAMDFLPQLLENQSMIRSQAKAEPKSPQMAIFYSGKVLVFDDFPPAKATEIMELATKLSCDNSGVIKNLRSASVENINEVTVPQTSTSRETSRPGRLSSGPDIRYPRRASLLKFLEKRKERVIAKGPYHMNPKHEAGGRSGGQPDQFCRPFDLNF
ncbi:hypothetical protein QN277_022260 [Acacia crassicarpa]|uniref:Protein TIFY n=1 Tax=Acacia crassicarpa TaxID=499986 RepID=A0AAE1JES3_9FABA|nr:hypothetical protein QN277_022260 [Acacia crassicarpa]